MKFISFIADKDVEYCYNAETIQRVSWHKGSNIIYIDARDKSYTHFFGNDMSAEFTYYNNILKVLKGE